MKSCLLTIDGGFLFALALNQDAAMGDWWLACMGRPSFTSDELEYTQIATFMFLKLN